MGIRKYTDENIFNEALKYLTRKEYEIGSNGHYQAGRRYGIHEAACKHMTYQEEQWTKRKMKVVIDKYTSIKDFRKNEVAAYGSIKRLGMQKYMQKRLKGRMYWNEKLFNELIKDCKTIYDVRNISESAYKWANNNNIKINLAAKKHENIKYTEEIIRELALRYKTREDFKKGNMSAVNRARKIGIFDEVCKHMERGPYGFDPTMCGVLYYISVADQAYKIGITNYDVNTRYRHSTKDKQNIRIIKEWKYEDGYECAKAEKKILKEFSYAKYNGDKLLNLNGNTELFKYDILGLDNAKI